MRITSILAFLPACLALGSVQDSITPSHSQDIWGRAAGYPGGYVYSIAQTADGYLWIGTSKGLVRYDGVTFVSIPEGDSSADTKFAVTGLVTDSSDQLWATDDWTHLFRYSAGRLIGPVAGSGKHLHRPGPVNTTPDGWLLFVNEAQGLVKYERGVARVLLDASAIPSWPTAVAQAADGTFWIGTRDEGLFHLEVTQGGHEVQHIAGLVDTKINCLLTIGISTVLVGTGKGLTSIQNGRLTREIHPELRDIEIRALASSREGDIWIGANGRLFKALTKEIGADGRIHSLDCLTVRFPVTSLFEDRARAGNLWIGGPEVIERYKASGFTSYLSSAGLPCTNCGSIYVDDQGNTWFAPWDGGLFCLTHGSIQRVTVAGLEDDTVYSIAGGGGELWAARENGGVTRLRLEGGALRSSSYTERDGLAENSVDSIYREPDGTVWAGTANKGLSRFRHGSWHTFTTRDGLPSNTISVITGNSTGKIFVGTPDGLAELKNNRWVAYLTRDGLPPGAIESLCVDGAGILWIGTAKGISFLQSGTIHVPVSAPDALFGEILGIAESNSWFWITTGNHVLRVKRSALLNDSFAEGDYREFGVIDGLPSVEGVKRSQSVVKDNRGRIWLSLNQGICSLQPSAFSSPASPVTIRLDGMIVDGKHIAQGSNIRVPSGPHRLAFQYAGVNISTPESVRYRYRLENVDSTWSEPTASREVDYTNIPPGQYRFEVMARDPDGHWSGHESTMTFNIAPAYYQTTWFRALCAAGFLVLLWMMYKLRLGQLGREFNARLEERVSERTRIARELHDTLLQSFQASLVQMHTARTVLSRRPEQAVGTLDQAISVTEEAIAEGRDAIQDLRSQPPVGRDFAKLLTLTGQDLARSQDKNGKAVVFRVALEGEQRNLEPLIQDEAYRIARELLRNAFQHANASGIEAEIRCDDRLFRLRIRDDGKGIERNILKAGSPAGHWGLLGMRERAKRIGGELEIWSQPGAGTEVELSIPASIAYVAPRNGRHFPLFRRKRAKS